MKEKIVEDREYFNVNIKQDPMYKKFILLHGVLRRILLYLFKRKYVEESISRRKGNCVNCGACCKLAFKKCPYLIEENRKSLCKIYTGFRMLNCKIFPIDKNDINDRNMISKKSCGYYF
jgi:hypothetical protein